MSHVHLITESCAMILRGLIYPCRDALDLGDAMGVTGGGEVYVSRKGVPSLTLVREFAGVRNEEHRALRDWYVSVSHGMRNCFIFVDGDASSHTVRWINSPFEWQKDAENRWSGTLRLHVEDFEP